MGAVVRIDLTLAGGSPLVVRLVFACGVRLRVITVTCGLLARHVTFTAAIRLGALVRLALGALATATVTGAPRTTAAVGALRSGLSGGIEASDGLMRARSRRCFGLLPGIVAARRKPEERCGEACRADLEEGCPPQGTGS